MLEPAFQSHQDKTDYKFKEVVSFTEVKPYVLRFWETEFSQINPRTAENGQKIYSKNDVYAILKIKGLLFDEKMSIPEARAFIDNEMVEELTAELSKNETIRDESSFKLADIAEVPVELTTEMKDEIKTAVMDVFDDTPTQESIAVAHMDEAKEETQEFSSLEIDKLDLAKTQLHGLLDRIHEIQANY